MGIFDKLANRLGYARLPSVETSKAHLTIAPYARAVRFGVFPGNPKKGTRILRHFAEANEWVRVAINRRKHQIGQAEWQIIRVDDKHQDPDEGIVTKVNDLFRFVNPTMMSFRSLLDEVIEDILVLDAGCIEKDKTLGGEIVALWPVDGGTIVVDPAWDGSQPNAPRYSQWDNFTKICELQNNQLVYMMQNPRSHSAVGFSPVEALVRIIEAELYGEEYDFEQLKGMPPMGILALDGAPPEAVEKFREYWQQEIAGSRSVAVWGTSQVAGGPSGAAGGQTKFIPMPYSSRESERMAYKEWLAKKIAAVFEMDMMEFNIHEGVNRSTSQTMQGKTDQGLVGLASLVAEYVTREIIWEIDPSHRHGFRFDGLTERDEQAQATIDSVRMEMGVTTPNEIRARDGLQEVPWGDIPWAQAKVQAMSEDGVLQGIPQDDTGATGGSNQAKPAKKPAKPGASGKSLEEARADRPFDASQRRRATAGVRSHYLENFEALSDQNGSD